MLIYLDSTVDQLAAENPVEIEELISELLLASIYGRHLILLDRAICDWAKDSLNLGGREIAQLDRLKALYSQRGTLPQTALSYLKVETGETLLTEISPHKYSIGHRAFLDANYVRDSNLLIEHIENDGEMLKIILREASRRHPAPTYAFQALHGGGADIAACLRVEIPKRHVVVSIADSDKVAPNDKTSVTKRNLEREAERQTFVGMVCETPCKEAENYIPLTILRTHQQQLCPEFSSIDSLETLIQNQDVAGKSDCLWLFFDLKKGIQAEKLDRIQNPPVAAWLAQKYQLGGRRFSDIEISGFGDGILRQFLDCGEAIKDFVKFMKTPYWATHFADFFDLVLWYFASEKKARGN
ncbi:hypothetical protein [Celeribacter halophilus]|uniref:hypothetical protein n=1 Tax=Celeribacter halophilus TaxID=576117 RepID=UPI003A8D86C7